MSATEYAHGDVEWERGIGKSHDAVRRSPFANQKRIILRRPGTEWHPMRTIRHSPSAN